MPSTARPLPRDPRGWKRPRRTPTRGQRRQASPHTHQTSRSKLATSVRPRRRAPAPARPPAPTRSPAPAPAHSPAPARPPASALARLLPLPLARRLLPLRRRLLRSRGLGLRFRLGDGLRLGLAHRFLSRFAERLRAGVRALPATLGGAVEVEQARNRVLLELGFVALILGSVLEPQIASISLARLPNCLSARLKRSCSLSSLAFDTRPRPLASLTRSIQSSDVVSF